jgi:hypothetical protein
MSVEINTWLLLGESLTSKALTKVPEPVPFEYPWLISIFLYVTWISIRVILFPFWMYAFYVMWTGKCARTGSIFNALLIVQPLHLCFVLLKLKVDSLFTHVQGSLLEAANGIEEGRIRFQRTVI